MIFPAATIVIDKYHVVQKVTQALDQVRKELQSSTKKAKNPLKSHRFLLLRSWEKLKEKHHHKLDNMQDASPLLAQAYFLKESFRNIYKASSYEEASKLLLRWLTEAENSGLSSFRKVAKTICRWQNEILGYFNVFITNARTEGTNHKIKNIKRRAYGYRNLSRFRLRVMLECTGLERARPLIELVHKIS
ncbi:transposase [Aneurinibacillus sp. Ricciae_BoGa-3]|nr:transposase [Aneurinibacillus sp. Ricciae_BoGa-3]WCK52540.1 transposase [Aneurinibacillus sp. Ricciae_BoGa-3]